MTGLGITTVIQSSSATTVMVVSFVKAAHKGELEKMGDFIINISQNLEKVFIKR